MNVQTAQKQLKKMREAQRQIQNLGLTIIDSDPWIPVKIQGKEYKLELSLGAVQEVLRSTGLTLGFNDITAVHLADMKVFLPILLAGLRTHHADVFTSDAGGIDLLMSMIPAKHLLYYQTCVQFALQATQPDPEEIDRIRTEATEEPAEESPLAEDSTSPSSGDVVSISDSREKS